MIGKKINQLATELAPVSTDLTIIGDPISGVSKKITLAQLGAIFSGAVSFYTDLASFPATGDINVIYCAKDTQKLYLWSGSAYTEVFPSQALLDTYQLRSEKGNANGYASLDSGGKVPISQLPSSIMEYKGTWNASTNTPTLANGTGDTGDVYICNVAGTVNFGAGPITFAVGDYTIYSGSIWQRSSGAVGTVTSVALTVGGDAISVSGSPLTTSGTLGLTFNGTTAQYIRGNGTLETFPSLTGFVPYTGATANVDLGTFDLTADIINLNQLKAVGSGGLNIYSNSGTHIALLGGGGGAGTTFYGGIIGVSASFTSSGSSDTFGITHSSGSGIALNITKGGNGEGLYINKTSGSGNAATIIGTLNATTLVKSGGTSAQFLKADGSVDSNTYVTIDTFETITASKNFALGLSLGSAGGTNQASVFQNTSSLFSGSAGVNVFGFNSANNIYFGKGSDNGGVLQWSNSTVRYYTLPNATGTIALTSDLTGGTVTSVGLSSATSGVTIGSTPITTSGTITLAIATASGSQQGLLSSTDWTTFNNKQSALTNPVTGTGTTNYLPKFTGASTIGNSLVFDNGTNVGIGTTSPDSKLHILDGAGNSLRIGFLSGTSNFNLYDAAIHVFRNNGGTSEYMRLNASGNLSIGNTNDSFKLDVTGTGRFTGALTGTSGSFSANISALRLVLNTTAAYSSSGTLGYNSNDGNYIWAKAGTNSNFTILNDSGSSVLTLASTGAATFSSSVQTGGNIRTLMTGTTDVPSIYAENNVGSLAQIRVFGTSAGGTLFGVTRAGWSSMDTNNGLGLLFGTTDTAPIVIGTSNTERMRIGTLGNADIRIGGNFGPYAEADRGAVNINGALNSMISFTTAGTARGYVYHNGSVMSFWNVANTHTNFATNDTERMRITSGGNLLVGTTSDSGYKMTMDTSAGNIMWFRASSGNVQMFMGTNSDFYITTNNSQGVKLAVGATSWSAYSDLRLKTITGNITSALSSLDKLSAVKYTLKADATNKQRVGLIAQEVQSVLPEAVDTDEKGILSVRYTEVIPLLVASIKELKQELDTLKNK
jgi:hypothetical protein